MWKTSVLVLLLLGALPELQALFEDEVGQYEWMVQQIGKPTALAYSPDASDRIAVASESGAVASVMLKDGTLQWRRVAAVQGHVRLLTTGSRGLISVTNSGLVQAWKSTTGDLTWQREYSDKVVDLLTTGPAHKQNVVILRESEVEARTMAGKHEWSVSTGPVGPKAKFVAATTSEDAASICAVALGQDGTTATAVQIDVSSGNVQKKTELPDSTLKGLSSGSFIVADKHLVLLVGDTVHTHQLCGEGLQDSFELRKVKSKVARHFQLMPWQRTAGVFAATNGATTAIFGLGPKGLKHLRTFDGVAVVGPVYSVHDDETGQPVAVAVVKEEGTQIQLLDPASGNVQPAIHAQGYTVGEHGPAQLLLVRELSSGEHRTVISAADHSLAGIEGTKVAWVREEALASVHQADFYSRAAVISAEKAEKAKPSSDLAALGAQLSEFPSLLGDLIQQPLKIITSISDSVTPKQSARRSSMKLMPNAKIPTSSDELRSFGADKLILVATQASKLFALEATSSEIVWQKYFHPEEAWGGSFDAACTLTSASDSPGGMGRCKLWMELMPSSSATYSELFVVTPALPGKSQEVFWLNPLNGAVLHQEKITGHAAILSIMPMTRKAKASQGVMPLLLVDSDRKPQTLPKSSADVPKLFEENAGKFFHYEVDRVAQVVQGFVIGGANNEQQLSWLWNLELGSVGERIVAAASPEHRMWEHVPVHIKGDASILYKYINPNLLVVVSEDISNKTNTSSLNVYALDAVTGHVLHQSHIVGGAQPVNLVVCDNWITMHYWNQRRPRFEITVIELFQAKADDGPWEILFGGKQAGNHTKSAHHLETPVPLQQTYIFPAGVTTMGVTATLKGITPRSIIMALTTEHIFRLSKDMLNPRRPHTSTGSGGDRDKGSIPSQFAPTKDELLPPYAPVMPLKPNDVLTYYNPMGQVTGIKSSPTALESTSLVFCYGLDLFFTPVQTAKAYDVLSPGFNYKLLYASVGVVIVLYVVTSYWAQYKALQDRWK